MGFKSCLDKLKLSSKEAIIDGEKDSFDGLKRYLHIEREAEQDLSSLISQVYQSDKPQLIFLLGNVGDGKSHLLARMWEKHTLEMNTFRVHNDATESISKNKTYLQTLSEVLHPYSDNQIDEPGNYSKTIIAINLGTLTNFLDEAGEGFKKLGEFIDKQEILSENVGVINKVESSNFRFINLADYHIFSLKEEGPSSQVLIDIITRITQKKEKNPFYQAYLEFYKNHPAPEKCPLKYNFDLLQDEKVKQMISQVLVQAIMNFKLIISVRLLMNFIYDIIAPANYSSLSDQRVIEQVTKSVYKSLLQTHLTKFTF